MGVIIDEFEIILDSQQDSGNSNNADNGPAAAANNTLKPNDIMSVYEQHELRCDRVWAH